MEKWLNTLKKRAAVIRSKIIIICRQFKSFSFFEIEIEPFYRFNSLSRQCAESILDDLTTMNTNAARVWASPGRENYRFTFAE